MKREPLNYIPDLRAMTVILEWLMQERGLQIVRYQEEGEEVKTSHGRSYWEEGEVRYTVEPIV